MSIELFFSFFSLCALLALSPGPDNIFVLLQTSLYGARVGFVIVLGLCTGVLLHTLLVTLGVAALLKTSPTAFTLLRTVGALYLVYLAYLTLRARPVLLSTPDSQASVAPALWPFYRRGVLMSISNPKVSLFFLAFLPQFTYSNQLSISAQMLMLSLIFILAAWLVFNMIVLCSAYVGQLLLQSYRAQIILHRITALVFGGLALRLLWF